MTVYFHRRVPCVMETLGNETKKREKIVMMVLTNYKRPWRRRSSYVFLVTTLPIESSYSSSWSATKRSDVFWLLNFVQTKTKIYHQVTHKREMMGKNNYVKWRLQCAWRWQSGRCSGYPSNACRERVSIRQSDAGRLSVLCMCNCHRFRNCSWCWDRATCTTSTE